MGVAVVKRPRQARYGIYYTKKKPLTLAAIKDLPGI
jgi:hypothetical protein